ncbi:futalosine hydrolase [Paenibacillus nasutitermitis]|nr:futalosine hydrolase [Paenibacillus nasutitermitis]
MPLQFSRKQQVLIVASVDAEKEAVLRGLGADNRFQVIAGGVGAAAAAASAASALAHSRYDLVICAGIAGGFKDRAETGSIVVASEIIAADLGAETPEGFLSVDELGFGSCRVPVHQGLTAALTEAIRSAGIKVIAGPVLTVSTATGTAETAELLEERIPGAAAEAMEGYGIGTAASQRGIPVLEIRAISNSVGPRDRDAWRIGDALKALEEASAILSEVLS